MKFCAGGYAEKLLSKISSRQCLSVIYTALREDLIKLHQISVEEMACRVTAMAMLLLVGWYFILRRLFSNYDANDDELERIWKVAVVA
jgi:hypothetical protein